MATGGAPPRIGLALSGGGARGLAHIPVLEALDDLGLKPAVISGTSIGAIMGAGYAAGMSGAAIRDYALSTFANRREVLARLWRLRPKLVGEIWNQGSLTLGQFDAERILDGFLPDSLPPTLDELTIPMKVVATDFYGWKATVLRHGSLVRALAASAALPILFKPVQYEDQVLIDGGIINPMPFDILGEHIDLIIAVDVLGGPVDRDGKAPTGMEAMFGATQLLMQSVVTEKMHRQRPPDILVRPKVEARVLEFMRAKEIIAAAEPVRDEVKHLVDQAMRLHV